MKMMKKYAKVVTSLTLMGLMALAVGCGQKADKGQETAKKEAEAKPISIGITQIVEHPSLDEIRGGIIQALEDKGYKDGEKIAIDFKNAGGSQDTSQLIASGFKGKDYVVAITTPSAQAALNNLKDTPIIYSGVTAPEEAGLVGDKITGVSDRTPIKKQLQLLQQLLPEAKKVGIIYNSGEANSEVQVNIAKEVAKELGLELVIKSITTTNDIALALDSLVDEVDAIYTHVDNTVASGYPIIVQKAKEAKVPIIGAVEDYVKQGALAVDGINNFKIGYQTGEMLVRIMEGESFSDNPFETIKETELIINEEVLKEFNITLPKALEDKVVGRR